MSDRDLYALCPELQILCQQFLDQCHSEGINVFVTQTYRGEEEQNSDYAQGRSTQGHIITNAQFGQSPHNCQTADGQPAARGFDFAIKTQDGIDWNASDPQWKRAIAIGKSLGLVSGSEWHSIKDNPHMELPNWKSV